MNTRPSLGTFWHPTGFGHPSSKIFGHPTDQNRFDPDPSPILDQRSETLVRSMLLLLCIPARNSMFLVCISVWTQVWNPNFRIFEQKETNILFCIIFSRKNIAKKSDSPMLFNTLVSETVTCYLQCFSLFFFDYFRCVNFCSYLKRFLRFLVFFIVFKIIGVNDWEIL